MFPVEVVFLCYVDDQGRYAGFHALGKLSWMCRLTLEREMAALAAIRCIEKGETAEYEVIYPLGPGDHLDTSH